MPWRTTEISESIHVEDAAKYSKNRLIPIGNLKQEKTRLPEGYTQVEFIESTGGQYVDTGVNADSKLRVVLDLAYTNPSTSNQNVGAVKSAGSNTIRYHLLTVSGKFRVYTNTTGIDTIEADTNRHFFDIDAPNGKIYVDDKSFNKAYQEFDTNLNFWLFGRNSTDTKFLTSMKLYRSKMYYENILVRDFIPCVRNSDNVAGLYDSIGNEFYENAGTGSFIAGNVVTIPNPDYPQEIEVVKGKQIITKFGKNHVFKHDNIWYNSNTRKFIAGQGYACIARVKANTTYTISKKNAGNRFLVITSEEEIKDGVSYSRLIVADKSSRLTYTFTTNENEKYVLFGYYLGSDVAEKNEAGAETQIEEGDTATNYEPYHEEVFELDLGNIELAKINDNADVIFKNKRGSKYYNAELEEEAWYKYETIKKHVFDGGNEDTYDFYTDLTDVLAVNLKPAGKNRPAQKIGTEIAVYCNKFTYAPNTNNAEHIYVANEQQTATGYIGNIRLYIAKSRLPGYSSELSNSQKRILVETWLQENPITVRYISATPVYKKIPDPELIQQLEKLNELSLEKGINNIFIESENGVTAELQLEYMQDINIKFEKRIKALEDALSTN